MLTQRHGKEGFLYLQHMDGSIVKTVERTGQALTLFLSAVAVNLAGWFGGIGVTLNIMRGSPHRPGSASREIGIRPWHCATAHAPAL
ncbi:hypothetical protein ACU4GD_22785 [Cupriavidus basilensis]